MTPEQQRIKIAEACGWTIWKHLPTPESGEIMPAMIPPKHLHDQGEPMRFADELPDYLNDLNAMHEAEITLDPTMKLQFRIKLWSIMREPDDCIHATAKQRAEAFLRTLNLWEE